MTNDQLVQQLQWRYATKQFDPARKIPADTWAALEQALVLSPSSFGLQPWKFIVVSDPAVKAQLPAFSWNQTQPADCSQFVVFAYRSDIQTAEIERFVKLTADTRGMGVEALAGYRDIMVGFAGRMTSQQRDEWAIRQTYIAIGNFMTSAAVLGVDACPMEGISPADYDRVLGLEGSGFKTVVACAAGYRADTDKYATLAKIRYPASEVIQHI